MNRAFVRALPLGIYRAFSGGMPVLMGLFIAATWGLRPLGAYTVASSIVAVALIVADWGSSRLLPRELAKRSPDAAAVMRTTTGVRLVLTAVAVALGFLYALGSADTDVLPFLVILAPVAFAAIVSTNAVSARVVDEDLGGILFAVAAGVVPPAVAAVLVRGAENGATTLAAAYAIGKFIETALVTRHRWNLQRVAFTDSRRVFALLLPFGASAVMGTVYSRLPVFVLEAWGRRGELGIVAAATAVQNVMLLGPTTAALILYPRLTIAASTGDRSALHALVRRYLWMCVLFFLGGLGVLWASRAHVLRWINVPHTASVFFGLYVAMGFLSTINAMASAVLQASGAERRAAAIGFLVIFLSVPLQIFSARAWGMKGTLAALATSELLAMVLLSTAARRAPLRSQGEILRATATTYGEK